MILVYVCNPFYVKWNNRGFGTSGLHLTLMCVRGDHSTGNYVPSVFDECDKLVKGLKRDYD